MKIGMMGLGKLGLPVALAIESKGHTVYGYDIRDEPFEYLHKGAIPYQEEGLETLLKTNNIIGCSTVQSMVGACDIIFVPIQTPHEPQFEGTTPLGDTRADFNYDYLLAGLKELADMALELRIKVVVAVISTCLPGTFEERIRPILNSYVSYVYTPQFIAMGTVLEDYLHPEFNLIGVEQSHEGKRAADLLEAFYIDLNGAPSIRTDITTAEGIKVSYNSWITAKTVLANAWGELSDRMGMDFDAIKMSWDLSTKRLVSTRYTDAGMGDGGGCHPRDNIAMSYLAKKVGMSHDLWEDLMLARECHEYYHASRFHWEAAQFQLPMVLLGRSFKPETNIETGSPALLMANFLKNTWEDEFVHVEDWVIAELGDLPVAVYFIGTKNDRYIKYPFPAGSIVLDPFGYIPDREMVAVKRLGRR
jgi:UDPglucose 6-dehydrogenase